jgi:hypothetical protein
VEELVAGRTLKQEMERRYGDSFRGVRTAREFFTWARKIVDVVGTAHGAQVVHGDIWQANIMVDSQKRVTLIDFGEAELRALELKPTGKQAGSWMPPEKGGTIEGDIYGIGGTLFYLATGREDPLPWIKNQDELKQFVVQELKRKNRLLNSQNWGIADIIASCIRYRPESRPRNTLRLRLNIEMFDRGWKAERRSTAALQRKTGSQLFGWLASCRERQLNAEVRDMKRGVFDLVGAHDELVLGMTQFISILDAGDEYLTISTPSLWKTQNLGIMGRFLSMNRLAAQKGATLRRIFLISPLDRRDKEFKNIISAHVSLMRSMPRKIQTKRWETEKGGFYAGVVEVTEQERQRMISEGDHLGVLIKGTVKSRRDGILMIPVYDDSGLLIGIQMRRDKRLVEDCGNKILGLLKESANLEKWSRNNRGPRT